MNLRGLEERREKRLKKRREKRLKKKRESHRGGDTEKDQSPQKIIIRKSAVEKKTNAKEWKTEVKESYGGCQLCGYNTCNRALEFHHVDPTSKNTQVSLISDRQKFIKEARKCILVCTNCHREIHSNLISLYLIDQAQKRSRVILQQHVRYYPPKKS